MVREGCGGPQSPEASGEDWISLWHWQSFEGRQLSLAAAWSEQEAGGQVQWRRSQQRQPGMPLGWAGAAQGPGFRAHALENRPGVGERQADPVLLCVGVGTLSETGAGPGQVRVPFGTCWAKML